MRKFNYLLAGLAAVSLVVGLVLEVRAGASGISDPAIAVKEFTPSGGSVFKDQVKSSLDSLDTAVEASIDILDTVVDVAARPSAAGSVSGTTNTVTITVKDVSGTAKAERRLIRVWTSETAYGIPATNNITSMTLSGGTAIQTVTAISHYVYLTGTNGTASAVIIGIAAGTNYVQVADGGYVTSAAVVFQ